MVGECTIKDLWPSREAKKPLLVTIDKVNILKVGNTLQVWQTKHSNATPRSTNFCTIVVVLTKERLELTSSIQHSNICVWHAKPNRTNQKSQFR